MSEDTWEQMHEADEKGQWASLLELCAVHLKQNPEHLQAQIPRAVALRHLNRFQEAVTLLQQTYADRNASEKCKYQCQRELGQTFEEMGRFDDARRAYDEAHRLVPDSTIPIIYRGVMELRVGEFAAAREWLNRAFDCPEGDFDEAHFNIAGAYLSEQNYPKAIEHYQKAITLDPNYDIAFERLADAKRALEIRHESK
ncbi:MAG TPA: tetratricopeptide repeat protein [Chthoniobacterales bacterium]|jgi:tetratricopeptide (TPR) repeat protein|nr:tetratricopeptide repeat protein [Chthoniobacterales bacterium]